MKKFITFALAALVIFAMCSCQPVQEVGGDKISFTVGLGGDLSSAHAKSISASDVGKTLIDEVQLAFKPLEQDPETHPFLEGSNGGEYYTGSAPADDDWISGYLIWDDSSYEATWNNTEELWLSQGQWEVRARAVDVNDVVLYEGSTTYYVSKKTSNATVKMMPKTSTATGTLEIGKNASGVDAKIWSTTISSKAVAHEVAYSILSLNNFSTTTGTLECEEIEVNGTAKAIYEQATKELTQGSYLISMTFTEYDDEGNGAVTEQGGSAATFGIFEDQTSYVWGNIEAAEFVTSKITAATVGSSLTLAGVNDSTNGITNGVKKGERLSDNKGCKYTFSVEAAKADETAEVKAYIWILNGKVTTSTVDDVLTAAKEFDLPNGRHTIQVIAVGASEAAAANTYDIQSELITFNVTVEPEFN